jgi:hypothetical protein
MFSCIGSDLQLLGSPVSSTDFGTSVYHYFHSSFRQSRTCEKTGKWSGNDVLCIHNGVPATKSKSSGSELSSSRHRADAVINRAISLLQDFSQKHEHAAGKEKKEEEDVKRAEEELQTDVRSEHIRKAANEPEEESLVSDAMSTVMFGGLVYIVLVLIAMVATVLFNLVQTRSINISDADPRSPRKPTRLALNNYSHPPSPRQASPQSVHNMQQGMHNYSQLASPQHASPVASATRNYPQSYSPTPPSYTHPPSPSSYPSSPHNTNYFGPVDANRYHQNSPQAAYYGGTSMSPTHLKRRTSNSNLDI